MIFTLTSGRTIPQGSFVEHKLSKGYQRATSTLYIHPMDLFELGIESGDRVRVSSSAGSVVLTTEESEELKEGIVFIALGPYANAITGGYSHSTGMPDYKEIPVAIEPSEDPVPTVWDLMEMAGGIRYDH
ncbi:molybdopterin dinucleotide binding domain-containing protein [Methanocalculus sp. MSAO_Arc2]|uniref:molybdopterin dinucleotide binding domain-containing protein n=1 Tax=Methanocalculus sp. MSAO_Arc2 TaxID=2293855 RepID=UPI002680488A